MITLFMTEIRVSDPDRVARWYEAKLRLRVALRDESKGFVLLEAPGGGRLALKQSRLASEGRDGFRLFFEVQDVDAERERLIRVGVAVGEPTTNAEEHYREIRLTDPEGAPITLFSWSQA